MPVEHMVACGPESLEEAEGEFDEGIAASRPSHLARKLFKMSKLLNILGRTWLFLGKKLPIGRWVGVHGNSMHQSPCL